MGNELRTHRRYAEYRKGTSDKFYEVAVSELADGRAEVIYRYGRIGQAGQSKPDSFYSFNSAALAADNKFEEKLKKGYVEAKSAMHALAAAFEAPEDRPVRGLKPAPIEVPAAWGLDAARNERLSAFAQKYLDKLNLIRGSKDILDHKAYKKQVTNLLEQFVAEWHRIVDSKMFSDVEITPARARVGVFYQALRSHTGTQSGLNFEWSSIAFSRDR